MRWVLFALCGVALLHLTGCQTVAEIAQALAPIVSDTVANSLALQTQELWNQAAKGNPIGPDELAMLQDGFKSAFESGLAAGKQSAASGAGAGTVIGTSVGSAVVGGILGALGQGARASRRAGTPNA